MPSLPDSSKPEPLAETPDVQGAAAAEESERAVVDYQPAVRHDPYAALRHRDFRLYTVGWLFATVAYQMQSAAIGWEIYQWTGSALSLGLTGGVAAIPLILLALPAGHLADLLDRRRIAMICAALTSVCSGLLVLLSVLVSRGRLVVPTAVPLLYGIILVNAVITTFARPARAALLPQILPASVFSNGVMWNSSVFELSSAGGPALMGVVLLLASPAAVYVCSATLSILFLICLAMLHHRAIQGPARHSNPGDFVAGVRFVWRTKVILATITLDLFAVLLGGATYLLPAFASGILHVGPVGFGWLRAAPSMGAICMALALAHRRPMQHAGRTMLLAVSGFGLAIILFGISKWFWVSMAALFLTGALDNISVVVRHTLVQLLTPDRMRGRVSAVNAIFIGSSNELGGLESGITAAWWGPVASVIFGGCGTIVVVALVALVWPQVRRIGSLQDVRPDEKKTGESVLSSTG